MFWKRKSVFWKRKSVERFLLNELTAQRDQIEKLLETNRELVNGLLTKTYAQHGLPYKVDRGEPNRKPDEPTLTTGECMDG